MAREIRYRGIEVNSGKWVFGCYQKMVVYGIMEHFILPSKALLFDDVKLKDVLIKVIPETVGQLWMETTNLSLYDGDIFDFPKHNVRFVVKYNEKRHQFCVAHPDEINSKYCNPWQCPDEKWIEEFMKDAVLSGNIYDNKYMLK